MSFEDSHEKKERIRQATDIVELIGASIQLRRAGRDHVGICPFHDDTSPSLRVNPGRQSWKCWVCNIGGDVYSFVMQHERVGFGEAIKILADKAGIPLDDYAPMQNVEPGSPDDKATLYKAVEWAEEQFHQQLLNSAAAAGARDYLQQRGIEPHCVEEFRVGFAPESWTWLLEAAKKTSFSPAVLQAVDLVTKRENKPGHFDRFRGRIMFPIRDTQNRAIAFGGRVMPGSDDKSKYINSRETRLFSKSDTLYGLNFAREAVRTANEIVVMEGFTDVIMAHQFGFKRAVAALGTALNERHIKFLRRFADQVT
ncbi:MAG: DNA primase [Pirellulaceae bacterium]